MSKDSLAKSNLALYPEEEWRFIPGSSTHEVSSAGRVRSWVQERTGRRLLEPQVRILGLAPNRGCPYNQAKLRLDDGRSMTFRISRLVMMTFTGPCPEGMEVAHSNSNSLDDRLCNLRYATHAQNLRDSDRALSRENLRDIYAALAVGETYESIAKRFNRGVLAIARISYRKTHQDLAEEFGWLGLTKEQRSDRLSSAGKIGGRIGGKRHGRAYMIADAVNAANAARDKLLAIGGKR